MLVAVQLHRWAENKLKQITDSRRTWQNISKSINSTKTNDRKSSGIRMIRCKEPRARIWTPTLDLRFALPPLDPCPDISPSNPGCSPKCARKPLIAHHFIRLSGQTLKSTQVIMQISAPCVLKKGCAWVVTQSAPIGIW